MATSRTAFVARLRHALDGTAFSGSDIAFAGCTLLAVLVIANVLPWPWVAVTVGATGAAIIASAQFRSRRHAGLRDWAFSSDSEASAGNAEKALVTALSGLPDAAIILDGRLAVLEANDAARQAFSIAPGRHIALAVRAPELLQAVDAALEQAEIQTFHLQLPPPLDRSFAVRITPLGSPAAGRPTILILLRDMTEQEQLSRMRADFVANASHELRTPLASLKGFIETLQGAGKNDAGARDKFLGIMQEQASRMSRLIDDLLSLSRIEMREHVPPSGIVDLANIVTEVAVALKPMGEAADIAIEAQNAVRPVIVTGDQDELTQVVQNLVQNAIKYGRSGGKVEIRIAREGLNWALAVQDNGIGIAPEHLPRLTERFYRVSAKDSRERGGTGLGLAIVKHIVARHRGQLRIASVQGQGSTFTVILPAASSSENMAI